MGCYLDFGTLQDITTFIRSLIGESK